MVASGTCAWICFFFIMSIRVRVEMGRLGFITDKLIK